MGLRMAKPWKAVLLIQLIDQLFSGKIRARLLFKLFINPDSRVHLRGLERDFDVSSNTVRLELGKLKDMSLIKETEETDNSKVKQYSVNDGHPMFQTIRGLVMKYVGIETLVEDIIKKLGNVHEVYLTGDLASGIDSPLIDLLIIGKIDKKYLLKLIDKVEPILNKSIRFGVVTDIEKFNGFGGGKVRIY